MELSNRKGQRPVLYSQEESNRSRSSKRNICAVGGCVSLMVVFVWVLLLSPEATDDSGIFNFSYRDIQGNTVKLTEYTNKVLLIVNVASECGFTASQYEGLQQLYSRYKSKGRAACP